MAAGRLTATSFPGLVCNVEQARHSAYTHALVRLAARSALENPIDGIVTCMCSTYFPVAVSFASCKASASSARSLCTLPARAGMGTRTRQPAAHP